MIVLSRKCPICDANIRYSKKAIYCSYCHSRIFYITNKKPEKDITKINPKEFSEEIERCKTPFAVNIRYNLMLKTNTADASEGRIRYAAAALKSRNFSDVKRLLYGIDNTNSNLFVLRLRILAEDEATNEYELLHCKNRYFTNSIYFPRILELADEKTKETYEKIYSYRCERLSVCNESYEVDKLIKKNLYSEALSCANELCRKHPYCEIAWYAVCHAKGHLNLSCKREEKLLKKCPDYGQKCDWPWWLYDKE